MKKYALFLLAILPFAAYSGTIDSESKFKRNIKGYPIEAVIEQWGQPNIADKKRNKTQYIWKSCYETGIINTQCHYGSCQSWRDTKCCYQGITVDNRGIMQDYSDRGDDGAMCYSSLDYDRIHRYQKRHDTMYGKIGFVATAPKSDTVQHVVFSTNVDNATVQRENSEDCGGKCIKTVEFKNTCVAVARPNTGTRHIKEYFVVKDTNEANAVQKAKQQCDKKFAKQGGCLIVTWDSAAAKNSPAICAIP